MGKPLISVVIPAYNEEDYVLDCLRSVFSQDFSGKYEVIVVDNNSNDRTKQIVRKNFPEARLFQEKKQGVVFARIKGINKAWGKIIVYTDADTIVPPNWLRKIFLAYENPNVIAVGGPANFSPATTYIKVYQLLMKSYRETFKLMWGCNMSFRKEAYKKCGGFSPKVNLAEEFYISLRLKKAGRVKILREDAVLSSSRRFGNPLQAIFPEYIVNMISLLLFGKAVFFSFSAPRPKPDCKSQYFSLKQLANLPLKKKFVFLRNSLIQR